MVVSRKTIESLIIQLRAWQIEYGISNDAMFDLLKRLQKIEGNKSFKLTIKGIIEGR